MEHFSQGIFRPPRDTFRGHKAQSHRRESDPLHHAAVKAVVLRELAKSVNGVSGHQSKIRRAFGDLGFSQATDCPVKPFTREVLEKKSATTAVDTLRDRKSTRLNSS